MELLSQIAKVLNNPIASSIALNTHLCVSNNHPHPSITS